MLSLFLQVHTYRFVLQIGQRDFIDTGLEAIGRQLCSLSSVDKCFANVAHLEHGRCFDVVPILTGKGVDHLLLGTLLAAFGQALPQKKKQKITLKSSKFLVNFGIVFS